MAVEVFGLWNVEGIKVVDPGLSSYVALKAKIVPKTGARHAKFRFHKSQVFIIERLINKMMVVGHRGKKHSKSSGHNTGKKAQAMRLVKDAFTIIEQKIKKNPIEVFVKALENAAPREEIITIEYGGARYPKAVECAPQRRVDFALRQMTQGAYKSCFNKKISAASALANEIIAAYQFSAKSNAISKKRDLERQASSSK